MRVVVQRVAEASVTVDGAEVGRIGRGLLLLVGVADGDSAEDAAAAAAKIAGLRIFPDESGRMNLSPVEAAGAALVVSQFTLLADLRKGRRPSFMEAADPADAEPLVAAVAAGLEQYGLEVEHGSFGATMAVSLVNDGPVTIVLDVTDGRVE
jgi:D-tyrosyl-tRNA(Tyr) deacylase